MEIKRIGPKSLGKVAGLTYAIFGFIGGLFFLIISFFAQNSIDATGAASPNNIGGGARLYSSLFSMESWVL
jgi:hypothetical protein